MRKPAIFAAALVLVAVSAALAAQPKPKACDSWYCKGKSCAPAKYAQVRSAPTLLPLFASPLYGAVVIEGGIGFAAVGVAAAFRRRRRTASESMPAPTPRETGEP
jgi:hypothetical protein